MIDRDRADATEYQKVKSTFDYVNDLLGNNQNIPSEQLVSAYQQLESIRTCTYVITTIYYRKTW